MDMKNAPNAGMLSGLVSFVKARRIESAAPGAFRHKPGGITTKVAYIWASAVGGFRKWRFFDM